MIHTILPTLKNIGSLKRLNMSIATMKPHVLIKTTNWNPTASFNFTESRNTCIYFNVYTEKAMATIQHALDYMSSFKDAYKSEPYSESLIKLDITVGIFRPFRFWPYVDNPKDLDFIRPPKFRSIECKLNGEAFSEFCHDGEQTFKHYFDFDSLSHLERVEMLIKKWQKHLKKQLNDVFENGRNAFSKDIIDEINVCDSIIRNWNGEATAKDLKNVGHPLTPFEEAIIFDQIMTDYDDREITVTNKNQKWFDEIMRYTTC